MLLARYFKHGQVNFAQLAYTLLLIVQRQINEI
jgi:hypothetical protein